jgi:hypothetical protein
MKKLIFTFIIVISIPILSICQFNLRHYATQEYNHQRETKNSSIKESRDEIERKYNSYKDEIEFKSISIPVIFHLMKNKANKYPKIKDIEDQVNLINIIFNRVLEENPINKKKINRNTPAEKYAAKLDLNFCLVKTVSGQYQDINYSTTPAKEWTINDRITELEYGGAKIIQPSNVINIYLADLKDNIAGYAQFPGGDIASDCIVIDYDFFGISNEKDNPYKAGKTLAHLMASYLGLKELWNEYEPCSDDGVDDTPIHNAPNYEEVGDGHISTCDGYPTEMVMNLMDNTHDNNLTLFTLGQKRRVHFMLSSNGPRYSLSQSALCSQNFLEQRTLANFEFTIHPNPSKQFVYIELRGVSENITVINISDISGKIIKRINIPKEDSESTYLNTSDLEAGYYNISAVHGADKLIKSLIIVK